MVHVILVKSSEMQKLDGMNITIQVQRHQNTFQTILTTVLHGLLYQMLQKMRRPGRTYKHHMNE